jgi:SAM-dependent methyltransferase
VDGARDESWSFDRATDYYDTTRAIGERAQSEMIAMLARELRGRGRCLEVGVGTGRVALPLHRGGIAMAGIDVSRPMVDKLLAKAGGRPFPLALASGVALPFRRAAFGAGLVCHVLHLVRRWDALLAQLVAVVRPGGVILVNPGTPGTGWWGELGSRFGDAAGIEERWPGVHELAPVDDAMARLGATRRPLPAIDDDRRLSPAEALARLEAGWYAFTWQVDQATRSRAAAAIRGWAERELSPLDEPRALAQTIRWRAYDLAA